MEEPYIWGNSEPFNPEANRQKIPAVDVTKTYTFDADQVKQLIVRYLKDVENVDVKASDIALDAQNATYEQHYSTPARANFTVRVKG